MPEMPYQTPSGVWAFAETSDRVFAAGVRLFNAEDHMLDLSKEWLRAMEAAREFHVELPPLAAVGALFTIDPDTRKTKEILPLGVSTLMRPIRYIRWSFARLGLLPSREDAPMELERAFTQAVFLGGRTLEFALMRAADGMVVWGHIAVGLRLLQQALDEGQPDAVFVRAYVDNITEGIKERERVEMGDLTVVSRYIDFARKLRQDTRLASLMSDETLRGIEQFDKLYAGDQDAREIPTV
jgi:hypothetical protein